MANEYNPNNALGTPNKYGGRTSVEGFSDGIAQHFSGGVVSGFEVKANSPAAMSVLIGGQTDDDGNLIKDVISMASDSTDDRFIVFNKSNASIGATIPTAPTANSRIDAVVVYRDQTTSGDNDTTDNPGSVGVVVVSGSSAASPVNPTEAQIRDKLPNGTTALYEVLAYVTVASGVTAISDSNIADARNFSRPDSPGVEAVNHELLASAQDVLDDTILASTRFWGKYASTSGTLAYNIPYKAWRLGSLVMVVLDGRCSAAMSQSGTSDEALPSAYRPSSNADARAPAFAGGLCATTKINTNGTWYWWASSAPSASTEWNALYVYFTDNDF